MPGVHKRSRSTRLAAVALVAALGTLIAACGTPASPTVATGAGAPALANQSADGASAASSPPLPGPSGSASPRPSASPSAHPASSKPAVTAPAANKCTVLPADNVWHADVSHLPVSSRSAQYVKSIGLGDSVHADFGSGLWDGGPIGIPVTYVSGAQPKVKVSFQYGPDSDKGPYPVPAKPQIEGGASSKGDRHVLLLDTTHCIDYELYDAYPTSGGRWKAGSGAIFDLGSDKLRPAGLTSADAAGLPILPGLVTYAEVKAGRIDHAIRVTVSASQAAYIWPGRHQAASSSSTSLPPMGLRLRLKASVDVSHLPYQARIVAIAMQRYGVIVADNGSSWFISGEPDSHWNNDQLHALGSLTGSDFEAVDESSLRVSANSGAAH